MSLEDLFRDAAGLSGDTPQRLEEAMKDVLELVENTGTTLILDAMAHTTGDFHLHLYTWMDYDATTLTGQARVAGNWEPTDGETMIFYHPFGEEPPWLVAAGASTVSTTNAPPTDPSGSAPAGAT